MANVIKIDGLSDAIKKELETYNQDVTNGIKIKTKDAMSDFVKYTKRDAPQSNTKRRGKFMRNIASKKLNSGMSGDSYVWYVKDPEYRLTHLIAFGHATRNGGRTQPKDFITHNYEVVEKKYVEDIEEVIKNGG